MSKYMIVIKDSFREALASRVLWVVLILITCLLLSLAPLGFHEELTWQVGDNDVRNWPKLMSDVRKAGKEPELRTPELRVWEFLDAAHQGRLSSLTLPGANGDPPNPFEFLSVSREFRRQLNAALEQRDFYDESYFLDVKFLSSELRQLRDEGLDALTDMEVARFNRLILESSSGGLVRASSPTSIQLVYANFQVGGSFPLRGETLRNALQSTVGIGLNWFVGALGILVAILVTAPIIPQMFDTGSLHLLLSKPVSRSLLFLAKFLGGCSFISIAAGYLIVGLWLILGVRFGVWDPKLLWSIPIYLFVFTIYYAVAALVGAVWRSPIVVVALTVFFWGVCFVVGWSKVAFETAIWSKSRWIHILEADDELLAVNEAGMVHRWHPEETEWIETFVSPQQRQASGLMMLLPTIPREMRPIGPVYDPENQRLIAAHPTFPPRPPVRQLLYVGARDEGWDPISNMTAPTGTVGLFRERAGSLLAVSSLGLFRLTGDPLSEREPVKIFGFTIPLNLGGSFQNISPDPPLLLTQPAAAALDESSGRLLVYTRATLTTLEATADQRFAITGEITLDGDERQPAVIAIAGDTIAVGREDGRVEFYDVDGGELRHSFQPGGKNQSRFIVADPAGEIFAIVLHNGELWVYRRDDGEIQRPRVSGQGDISAAFASADGHLFVADRTVRVSKYQTSDWTLADRFSPRLGLLETGYQYGLLPLYTIFPKPGELNTTIDYLLSGMETERIDQDDLTSAQRALDPWTPVWSSALFVVVVLLFSCIYIERQDF